MEMERFKLVYITTNINKNVEEELEESEEKIIKELKSNKNRILGHHFVQNNNNNKAKLIINNKKYNLKEFINNRKI